MPIDPRMPKSAWQLAPPFIYSSLCFLMLANIWVVGKLIRDTLDKAYLLQEKPPGDIYYPLLIFFSMGIITVSLGFCLNARRVLCTTCEEECDHVKRFTFWILVIMFFLFIIGIIAWIILSLKWV